MAHNDRRDSETLDIIANREGKSEFSQPFKVTRAVIAPHQNWPEFHKANHSEPGPKGLLRHKLDPQHCIGHGHGTWDLIVGEFS